MTRAFELETLKIRMSDAELQRLDLHQRIQRALRALILDGALDPGVKLPATRVMAASLGVARDTVGKRLRPVAPRRLHRAARGLGQLRVRHRGR